MQFRFVYLELDPVRTRRPSSREIAQQDNDPHVLDIAGR